MKNYQVFASETDRKNARPFGDLNEPTIIDRAKRGEIGPDFILVTYGMFSDKAIRAKDLPGFPTGVTWVPKGEAKKDDSQQELQDGRKHAPTPKSAEASSIIGMGTDSRRGAQTGLTEGYLNYLRDQSACKGLRGSITATFWFNSVLWLFAGVGCIIVLVNDNSTELDKTEAKVGLVIVFFAVNALIVYRQLATTAVTLVDSIVIRNRDADGGYESRRHQRDA